MREAIGIKPNSIKAWIMAFRPKTLFIAVAPVLVGSFLPAQGLWNLDYVAMGFSLLTAVFLTMGANLINDALDFKNGRDTKQRIGPTRATQSGLLPYKAVLTGGLIALSLAALCALPLIYKGGLFLALLTVVSLLAAYFYTGGPYPLAYQGLGELFVFTFYGLAATGVSYYLQTGRFDMTALIGSIQIGLMACVPISINNLRDIKEDRMTGKMTLSARFGPDFGRMEITTFLLIPFLLHFYWLFQGRYLSFILPMTTLFMAINIVRCIYKHPPGKIYNRYLGESSLLMVLFALLLLLGTL
ncbi:MAG: 1,4-dihydroxy-2-naphthoate octaprenyltransferase [Parachlamydiaceae bacterium]